jgi:hypothetical protein
MRAYLETIKKHATKAGVASGATVLLLFWFLAQTGAITIISHSGDMACAGTIEDPCIAEISFTANEDIYIYPFSSPDPWGRNTPFEFTPSLEDWKLQRSWGDGWRTIDLNKTWNKNVKYAIKFSKGKNYTVRILGYKHNPQDEVKWAVPSANLDPVWMGKSNAYFTNHELYNISGTIIIKSDGKTQVSMTAVKSKILMTTSKNKATFIITETEKHPEIRFSDVVGWWNETRVPDAVLMPYWNRDTGLIFLNNTGTITVLQFKPGDVQNFIYTPNDKQLRVVLKSSSVMNITSEEGWLI